MKPKQIEYRILQAKDINQQLFDNFIREQIVTKCWRKEGDVWIIKDTPFIDDWSEEDYQILISCLKNTIESKGNVIGAFDDSILNGFVSVESQRFGSHNEYLDVSSLHVSKDSRGQGIGKQLFLLATQYAKQKDGKKLYISAHSAIETQCFYKAMGCVEAKEYHKEHVEREPKDCQLEYVL
ncbi:MAG: GNAT family N-acetyltransferase [Coprobacillaceae bacterium]